MSNATPTQKKDIHAAITELVIELMGEGTVQALADRLKMSRNRLVRYIQAYHAQMKGEEYTPMHWDLDTLGIIAHELKIHVSDVIKAAEDVQNGLPAWFHYRISKDMPHSRERLESIFLEAVGCHASGDSDPLNVRGQRKSRYRSDKTVSKEEAFDFWKSIKGLLAGSEMKEYIEKYNEDKLSDIEAYNGLKIILSTLQKERGLVNKGDFTKEHHNLQPLPERIKDSYAVLLEVLNKEQKRIAENLIKSLHKEEQDSFLQLQQMISEKLSPSASSIVSKPQVDKVPEN